MCLNEDQFAYFLSLIDIDLLVPTLNGLKVSVTEWVWVDHVSAWCINGKWEDLPVVR